MVKETLPPFPLPPVRNVFIERLEAAEWQRVPAHPSCKSRRNRRAKGNFTAVIRALIGIESGKKSAFPGNDAQNPCLRNLLDRDEIDDILVKFSVLSFLLIQWTS
ncbi:hypothetical protein AVEN_144669-1 [Araneus ventricosus]|uniref:Uncharacterized protein n=1 Tax=Araneus ventricosus TaxID=182803 RepID=A0A4Y2B0B0_ARAVE|nr:hypothetical protein AVEN_144669-1 [Araneus ventricosus]